MVRLKIEEEAETCSRRYITRVLRFINMCLFGYIIDKTLQTYYKTKFLIFLLHHLHRNFTDISVMCRCGTEVCRIFRD
jgi:hypothetical protein